MRTIINLWCYPDCENGVTACGVRLRRQALAPRDGARRRGDLGGATAARLPAYDDLATFPCR